MKRLSIIILLVFFTVYGCSEGEQNSTEPVKSSTSSTAESSSQAFKSVSPAEAKIIMESKKDMVLVDLRTPQELKEGAIEGSTMVPFWAVMQNKLTLAKETPIMLVCAVGGRSYAAGQMLSKYGYKNIYNLSGGISAWKDAGLPVKY